MLRCWQQRAPLGKLTWGELETLPPPVEASVWAGMTEAEKKAVRKTRRDIQERNASAVGRENMIMGCLDVASDLVEDERFYYPHTMDFRGRLYPLPVVGPQPQGSDIAKALLEFADGKPLGNRGLYWLCVRAANCMGHDKVSLDERHSLVLDRLNDVLAAAKSPLENTWWSDTPEPWGLLATCFEIAYAFNSADPKAYVSHLPVPLDGTCSGLQVLSAMGLDPVGGKAVNLMPGPRGDIYQDVADAVNRAIEADVEAGVQEALEWRGNVSRKTVKRGVMTTPYGVTKAGMRKQLVTDKMIPAGAEAATRSATYLGNKIDEAMLATAVSAREIMAWLQDTAGRLAKAGLPLEWHVPTGMRIRQAYPQTHEVQIRTLDDRLVIHEPNENGALNKGEQMRGAAPNVVHSFDAAHLRLTVLAGAVEGVEHWAMIHDSFGTHACNTDLLAKTLRQQFVDIYRDDWLGRIHADIKKYAPNVVISDPPSRGGLDIAQVLQSEFFFS